MKIKALILPVAIIFLRSLLINFNVAEWGDSYNFLRAGDFITRFAYPLDEKRLPLFPFLISLGMFKFEPVFWARVVVFLFSLGCLYLTFELFKKLFPRHEKPYLAYTFLFFSPVFLYWSIRAMAEVVFTFWVLLAFYYFYSTQKSLIRIFVLGILVGLATLTRFEGYLLFSSFLIYFGFKNLTNIKNLLIKIGGYSTSFILIQLPWFTWKYYRSGSILGSSYFSEPGEFSYDIKLILAFVASLIFTFGVASALYFVFRGGSLLKNELKSLSLPIFLFLTFELILIILWPAAIPRLFFSIVPLLSIFFVAGLETLAQRDRGVMITVSTVLLLLYAVLQFKLRLYFLLISESGFLMVLFLSLFTVVVWFFRDLEKAKKYFLLLSLSSSILASSIILVDHRNIYATIYQAAKEAQNLKGLVAYFDETGVSRWYLRHNGLYYSRDYDKDRQWDWLKKNKVKYLLWTDEHNEGSVLNIVEASEFKSNFRLVNKYAQEQFDYLDRFLIEKRFLKEKNYLTKQSAIYEVVY